MHSNFVNDADITVAVETQGCKLNQSDSAAISNQFAEAGYKLVPFESNAHIYILNTCTVTHVADRKARQALRAIRRRSPNATIVATGCYAERAKHDLESMPEVDLVIGNKGKEDLVRRTIEWTGIPNTPCSTGDDTTDVFNPRFTRIRAMVKIQEGCDQICAYCIVPRVRGRERSILPEDIIRNINRCVASGYREIVLTGTQLGSYGFDIHNIDLTLLLKRILSETKLERLRVSSLQPQEIKDEMLDLWIDSRLCPHFHIPLQSGSDDILKRMRRRYTLKTYTKAIDNVRERVPEAAITTDIITGFPGEQTADHDQTYRFCEKAGFADTHVFPYSARSGTSAAYFSNKVSNVVKSARVKDLIKLSESNSINYKRQMIGQLWNVLWERSKTISGIQTWSGLTDNYVRVVCRSDGDLANHITGAQIHSLQNGSLYADIK